VGYCCPTTRQSWWPGPEDAAAHPDTDDDRAEIAAHSGRVLAGSPETVTYRLQTVLDDTGTDELMVTTPLYHHADRRRSYELLATIAHDSVRRRACALATCASTRSAACSSTQEGCPTQASVSSVSPDPVAAAAANDLAAGFGGAEVVPNARLVGTGRGATGRGAPAVDVPGREHQGHHRSRDSGVDHGTETTAERFSTPCWQTPDRASAETTCRACPWAPISDGERSGRRGLTCPSRVAGPAGRRQE